MSERTKHAAVSFAQWMASLYGVNPSQPEDAIIEQCLRKIERDGSKVDRDCRLVGFCDGVIREE